MMGVKDFVNGARHLLDTPLELSGEQAEYFKRIGAMELNAKLLVGFGISNAETYQAATAHSKGAIIGSAFIKHLEANGADSVKDFIKKIR